MNNLSKYVDLEKIKNLSMYSKAIVIANEVFRDIVDKGGNPYIYHLYDVSNKLDNTLEKTAGLLHDIIEDTDISLNDLKEVGFTDEVLDILVFVTRGKDELYSDFIDRIIESNNLSALKVKISDMENNMDLSRIKEIKQEDIIRFNNKYMPQYKKLVRKLGEYYDRH